MEDRTLLLSPLRHPAPPDNLGNEAIPEIRQTNNDEYTTDPNYNTLEDEIKNELYESDCFLNGPKGNKRKNND